MLRGSRRRTTLGILLVVSLVVLTPSAQASTATTSETPIPLVATRGVPADPPARTPCRAPVVKRGRVIRLRKNVRTTCGGARSVARQWVGTGRGANETIGLFECRGTRRVSCVSAGAKGFARVEFRYAPARSRPGYRHCRIVVFRRNSSLVYFNIRVRGVSCVVARRILRHRRLVEAGYRTVRVRSGACAVRYRSVKAQRVILFSDAGNC